MSEGFKASLGTTAARIATAMMMLTTAFILAPVWPDGLTRAPDPFDVDVLPFRELYVSPVPPTRPIAVKPALACADGTTSHAKSRRGACSHHGGIKD